MIVSSSSNQMLNKKIEEQLSDQNKKTNKNLILTTTWSTKRSNSEIILFGLEPVKIEMEDRKSVV